MHQKSLLRAIDLNMVPELPASAKLTDTQLQQEAGEKGANHLLSFSPRFRPIQVPQGKDIGEFHLQGGDIYAWFVDALKEKQSALEKQPHAL